MTQAPAFAISEPFIGTPKDFSVTAADLPTKKEPFAPPPPAAAEGFPIWPLVGAGLVGAGVIALVAADPWKSSSSTPIFFSP